MATINSCSFRAANLLLALSFAVTVEAAAPGAAIPVQPGASLTAAVGEARRLGVKRLTLAEGVYRVTETLELDERDSGLVIEAAAGAQPVLDGGIELGEPVIAADGLFEYSLSESPLATAPFTPYGTGIFIASPQLMVFRDGRMMSEAAEPNTGFRGVTEVMDATNFVFRADFPGAERLIGVEGLVAHGYWHYGWADQTVPIKVLKDARGVYFDAVPPGPRSYSPAVRTGRPFRLKGCRAFVDAPDEWFHDRRRGVLVMKPDKGRVTVTGWTRPFLVARNAKGLVLKGITFRNGAGSGILVEKCDGFVFERNTVENFAVRGLKVSASDHVRITGNRFTTFGIQGLALAGGDLRTLRRGGNLVEGNDFSASGVLVRSESHVLGLTGVGTTVTHNYFHDMPGPAVRMDGIGHFLASNLVERCVTESDDWGAFECFGPFFRDTKVIDNVFRDLGSDNPWNYCGQCGVRLDDMTSDMYIAGNRFLNASRLGFGGVQIHAGKNNVVEHNLFVGGTGALSETPWSERMWKGRMAGAKAWMKFRTFPDEWRRAYGEDALARYERVYPQDNVLRNNVLIGAKELIVCRADSEYYPPTRLRLEGNMRLKSEADIDRCREWKGEPWLRPLVSLSAVGPQTKQ